MSKITPLEQAAASIPDGATVAIGGLSMNSAPMALVRELVRQQKKDLTLVAIVAGMAVDWLVAGGCVRRVISGLVSFEGLGLAPSFRAAVQSGRVDIEEYSEHLLICRLQAQSYNLPFMPTRAGLGTDVLGLHAESGTVREEKDGPTGERYVACARLPIDVALVHAHEADDRGNTRVNPKLVWMDSEIVNAAARTVASVERVVDTTAFTAAPERTTYPRFMIDTVTVATSGAYPCSCFPEYSHDSGFFADYSRAARDPEEFLGFFRRRVVDPPSWEDFLAVNNVRVEGASA
ncbi:CoA transferase subunit A [Candidatus Poriferisocius sp.]|uniref:CoA transferase subunit A n=1 Tax=Candidatus Poriferisocius sp. TaxID=3101276 RepID=UPI003B01F752